MQTSRPVEPKTGWTQPSLIFQVLPGGFSPADHVPCPPETKPRRTRRTSSGDCLPGIPRLFISSLAICEVSRSRIVGAPAISASNTRSTSVFVSPWLAKISTSSVHPTRPAEPSTTATMRAHLEQTFRKIPALVWQYAQCMDKKMIGRGIHHAVAASGTVAARPKVTLGLRNRQAIHRKVLHFD